MAEGSSIADESAEPNYRSSLSFVDLIETIFSKKETKPPENTEQVPSSMNEGSLESGTISEKISPLSTATTDESKPEEMMTTTVD